jgi:DNA polymerase-3 subunit beta
MLNNLDSNDVKLSMSEPSRAGILTPVSDDNDKEDILMLVMPVMLNR